jgi:hypothetical protein
VNRFASTMHDLGATYTCLQALRRGDDSVDADVAVMILADFFHNVRGIAGVFRKTK